MGINLRYPPMEDDRVRRAMNWAIDRERYQTLIMKDIIEHTCLPWFSKTSLAYNEDQAQHYTLDLEESAKLMSAANAEVSTTMLYRASNLAEFIPIYQEDLRQIGVNLELNFVDAAAFAAGVNDYSYRLYAGGSGNNGPTHPSTIFSSSSGSWSADGNNYFGYENARHQELIEQGALEFDPDRIRSIYREINELLLASSHQMVCGPEPLTLVMASNVKGFGYQLKNNVDFERTWLAS
jgi:ABC-type transport system substrate-binding protein